MGARGQLKRFVRSVRARLVMGATAHSPYPIFPSFGWEDGTPIDRRFIDAFLQANAGVVTGTVLEVGDREYTTRYGATAVVRSDVLSAVESDDPGVIVADIASAPQIPTDTYDCIIFLQTLHYVFDMKAAVRELHRILKPGGTLLVCVPGISQVSAWDMERWGDRWRMTDLGLRELLQTCFSAEATQVSTYGNAASAVAFLQGIPAEMISPKVLSAVNPEYPILVAGAARKGGS